MVAYASPAPIRVDHLKPNDLVRINDFVSTKKELDLWANVLEVDPRFQDQGTKLAIHLGGGFEFVVEPDREYCCRVALGAGA